jgi:two-component sensor histidine kinase
MSSAVSSQVGQGRMGRLLKEFDWSSTPLGPIDAWSAALRSSVEMMLGQKHAICIFWGPDLTILYNDAYAPILGGKETEALGRPAHEIWSDVWDGIKPFVEQAMSGEGTWSEEMPLTMMRNGYLEETFWTFSYSPLYDNGRVAGMINVALDATPGVVARRKQEVLARELVHRVKNTLAVTAAVVSSTLRNAQTIEEARSTVAARIIALGHAQELLHGAEDDTPVRSIVDVAIKAHLDRPDRVTITGPETRVVSQQAVGLSLAVYELATNAVKYGSLSNDDGTVNISWTTGADGAFHFSWHELGGPAVVAPTKKGFGSRLTNNIVASYFSGKGTTSYDADGVRFDLSGVLDKVSAQNQ